MKTEDQLLDELLGSYENSPPILANSLLELVKERYPDIVTQHDRIQLRHEINEMIEKHA